MTIIIVLKKDWSNYKRALIYSQGGELESFQMLRNLGSVSFHQVGSDRGMTPDLCVGTDQKNWKLLSESTEHQGFEFSWSGVGNGAQSLDDSQQRCRERWILLQLNASLTAIRFVNV